MSYVFCCNFTLCRKPELLIISITMHLKLIYVFYAVHFSNKLLNMCPLVLQLYLRLYLHLKTLFLKLYLVAKIFKFL